VTAPSLYQRHRKWALSLAAEHDDSDGGRLTALVVLWRCVKEWDLDSDFRDFARPRILEALQRERVT
jgi:hypothetical protein